jgi:Fic family protein
MNGARAYHMMLDMAKAKRPITRNTMLAIHEAVTAGKAYAGTLRDEPVVSSQVDEMFAIYERDIVDEHPVVAGAKLHFAIAHIHPFQDGNGRTSRLLDNLHLISHGYPPVLIDPAKDKPRYFEALEKAHMSGEPGKGDPIAFVAYMAKMEERALERYLQALQTSYGHEPRGH